MRTTKELIHLMEVFMYIAALIAAASLAVLVIFLVITLKAARRTLDNTANTLENLNAQMQGITTETTELLAKTNHLADDVNQKSDKLNVLFDGFKGIGETADGINESIRKLSAHISATAAKNQENVSEVLKWGNSIIDFWKKKKS
ncbi:DUF948 domain-containing protein [Lentibacillus salinarum]|uniref:DUF948 domain-containing protein n=2 Tax=Lentibacillus salinarum TaxID=446820 RepID=A0ABW3ZV79_9BACI